MTRSGIETAPPDPNKRHRFGSERDSATVMRPAAIRLRRAFKAAPAASARLAPPSGPSPVPRRQAPAAPRRTGTDSDGDSDSDGNTNSDENTDSDGDSDSDAWFCSESAAGLSPSNPGRALVRVSRPGRAPVRVSRRAQFDSAAGPIPNLPPGLCLSQPPGPCPSQLPGSCPSQ